MAAVLTVATSLLTLPVPLLVQGLVDRVVAAGHWSSLPGFSLGLFGVFAAQAGLTLANTWVIGRVGQSWACAGDGKAKTLAMADKSPMLVAARGMIVPPWRNNIVLSRWRNCRARRARDQGQAGGRCHCHRRLRR